MKLVRFFILLGVLCFVGCGPEAGSVGDENDPAAPGGSDEEQMDETGEDLE